MLFRVWLAFSAVIALVLGVLAGLSVLQHNATYADLAGRRVSVIAQTVASAFQPIVDLGLPMSMVRNGDQILARAYEFDPDIIAAHAFNPSGIIVYSTDTTPPQTVPDAVLGAMQRSDRQDWSVETHGAVYGGFNVLRAERTVGSIVLAYPSGRLSAASRAMTARTVQIALAVWAVFSVLAYLTLRAVLAAPIRAIGRIGAREGHRPTARTSALLEPAIASLERDLAEADRRFEMAKDALAAGVPAGPADTMPPGKPSAVAEVAADPTRSLATRMASRLVPVAALFIVASALVMGAGTLRQVTRSFEPEFSARTDLIGAVVSENVQRVVSAGVPIDRLAGAEQYFGDMLMRLPEVARVAIVTPDGRPVLEAGDPRRGGLRDPPEARSHAILVDGEEIGAVSIEIDPGFVARSFRNVFLDMAVVVLVSILLSFEVMVLFASRSLTAPLDRLQRLAAMQAVGNFSIRAAGKATGTVGRLTALLSDRAETLHHSYQASRQTDGMAGPALEDLGRRFGLSGAAPVTLRLTHFTNIRLALFLFAAADELPASFLVLYTRAASNPWGWIESSIVISLPLAGYLLANFVTSPFARMLTERLGSRPLLLLAMVPVIGADVGLFWATSVPEIVLWRTVAGFGYALVVLACEDYVLDTAPRGERDRALGMFSAVYFGGIFAGTALGGVLADRFGQPTVFLVSAGSVTASLVLIASLTRASAARGAAGAAPSPISWRGALSSRRFLVLLAAVVAPAQIMDQAYVVFLVPLVLDGLGFEVADIARCLMLYCLAVAAVGNLPGRLVVSGLTPARGALVGQLAAGSALLLVAIEPDTVAMIAALTLAGFGFGLVRWATVSMAMEIAETELAHLGPASVLGTLRPFERIVSVAGLFAIAAVAGRIGHAGATATVAFGLLAGAILFACFAMVARHGRSLTREGADTK